MAPPPGARWPGWRDAVRIAWLEFGSVALALLVGWVLLSLVLRLAWG
jgi:hypothetical protein